MISQRYRTLATIETPSINRCLEVAIVRQDKPIIICGGNEQKAYFYDQAYNLIQEIAFDGWVRSCSAFNLDGDPHQEIAIGSGDNSLRVYKYDETSNLFQELWRFEFEKNVTAVAAGDINCDGRIEIVAGSWDKSLKVFDGLTGEMIWELSFNDWVTYIKIEDTNWDGIPEVIVGLKRGQFGVINGVTGDCYWDHLFDKKILVSELVVLANNEYPHLLVGGEEGILYIFDRFGTLAYKYPVNERILSISHGDIDGDCYNEIILGLGNNRLLVLESPNLNQKNENIGNYIELVQRWKARMPNAPSCVKVTNLFSGEIPKIVVTGYFKEIRILEDFFFGRTPMKIACGEIRLKEPSPKNYMDEIKDLMGEVYEPELLLKDGVFYYPKQLDHIDDLINPFIKEFYNFTEITALNKDLAMIDSNYERLKSLIKIDSLDNMDGLVSLIIKSIEEEISVPVAEPIIESVAESMTDSITESATELAIEPADVVTVDDSINDVTGKITGDIGAAEVSENIVNEMKSEEIGSKQIFINAVQAKGVVASKAKLQVLVISSGVSESEFAGLFTELKKDGILSYSRKTPRGYSIIISEEAFTVESDTKQPVIVTEPISEPVSKPISESISKPISKSVSKSISKPVSKPISQSIKITVQKTIQEPIQKTNSSEDNKNLFIELVAKEGVVSTKANLEKLILEAGISKSEFTKLFNELKVENTLLYSRKTPRGYSISSETSILSAEIKPKSEKILIAGKDKKDETTVPEKPDIIIPVKKESDLNGKKSRFIEIFKDAKLVSSKAKIIELMVSKGLEQLDIEAIIETLKKEGTLIYSRSKPRGYSLIE